MLASWHIGKVPIKEYESISVEELQIRCGWMPHAQDTAQHSTAGTYTGAAFASQLHGDDNLSQLQHLLANGEASACRPPPTSPKKNCRLANKILRPTTWSSSLPGAGMLYASTCAKAPPHHIPPCAPFAAYPTLRSCSTAPTDRFCPAPDSLATNNQLPKGISITGKWCCPTVHFPRRCAGTRHWKPCHHWTQGKCCDLELRVLRGQQARLSAHLA
jgi:hypothetical protein